MEGNHTKRETVSKSSLKGDILEHRQSKCS
jgi:hypothetical protein